MSKEKKFYLEIPENSYPKSCKECWIPCGFAELGSPKRCPFLFSEEELIKRMAYGIMIQPCRCNAKYIFSTKCKQEIQKAIESKLKVQEVADAINDVIDNAIKWGWYDEQK